MDTITFCFLIGMVVSERLEMHLMNVVTAYLYGSLDSDIHMKIPKGYKMPETYTPCNLFSIKLQRSLYGLKQSDRMWYKHLSEYLIKKDTEMILYAHVCSSRNLKPDLIL